MLNPKWERLGASVVAIVATEVFASFYDDILFPFAMAKFGNSSGGIGASVLALAINYLMVLWYRRTETDWYGFEEARKTEIIEVESTSKLRRFMKGKTLEFILLSVKDPFLGFACLVGRKQGGGISMDARDWGYFLLANTIGIGFWLILLTLVSETVGAWVLYGIGVWGILIVLRKLYKLRATQHE